MIRLFLALRQVSLGEATTNFSISYLSATIICHTLIKPKKNPVQPWRVASGERQPAVKPEASLDKSILATAPENGKVRNDRFAMPTQAPNEARLTQWPTTLEMQ